MTILIDTQLLLWAAGAPRRLSAAARRVLSDPDNVLVFSVASLWEIEIKRTLGRPDFRVDPHALRRGLLENGYTELPITGDHVLQLAGLDTLHKDPFDRILLSQALAERMTLLTRDRQLAACKGPVRRV